mmetsp:Transcript_69279/g.115148  ORF Transcript_69279/g.115148 Transcript_69279/m.115148 type:complete len:602 (+) Transcript_69279:220-2025(+)|eukprot:CAMPEP_0119301228 /NCGR_PEP_ID=MMETSP1333-20130426/3036_1 /TAXON_ID=418940 /ORGANISM="Scyphosphaera apsteinii, Strain RCC1455" /LENGTH=601 /DNA_ID=CAMNT_0007303243 /DNA_START=206 /DNA_END=2011 /DNA_ORIENTATION=+
MQDLAATLESLDLLHLEDALKCEGLDSLKSKLRESRPGFLQHLKQCGISKLAERQKLANGIAKLQRSASGNIRLEHRELASEPAYAQPMLLGELNELLECMLKSMTTLSKASRFGDTPTMTGEVAGLAAEMTHALAALPPEVQRGSLIEGLTMRDRLLQAAHALQAGLAAYGDIERPLESHIRNGLAHETIYPLWRTVPAVSAHFLYGVVNVPRQLAALNASWMGLDKGIVHVRNGWGERGGYSVYVPEHSTGHMALVCTLHGATGHGRFNLYHWLKVARGHGNVAVLAPTSAHQQTWSLLPEMDDDYPRLLAALDDVQKRWPVDPKRLLLTGMSDGGTFAWLSGLREGCPFTHLGPVASGPMFGFPPLAMLLQCGSQMRTTLHSRPVFLVHGARDDRFDIVVARRVAEAVGKAGARLRFCELADCGHTHPIDALKQMVDWLHDVPKDETTASAHKVGVEMMYKALVEQETKAGVEAGAEALRAAAAQPGAYETGSGLVIQTVAEGSGETPTVSDTVRVHYEGKLVDGTVFDSSYKRDKPAEFPMTKVIPGWTEALQLMRVGQKCTLTIPHTIAYGAKGAPPRIPPNATLVFQVELLGIVH